LKQLKNLRADMTKGTRSFKLSLIKDALLNPKDVGGNSYAAQFMRHLLVIGGAVQAGRYVYKGELLHQVFHPGIVELENKGVGLALNPLMGAAYSSAMKEREEDEFWVSDFLQRWLLSGSGGKNYFGPAALIKAERLTANDIPAIYKESKLRYLFAIPAMEEE